VILKPSEITPLTSMLMGDMLRECGLPDDVYQVCHRLRRDGQRAGGRGFDFIMFTGSTKTGRRWPNARHRRSRRSGWSSAAKDPMIVFG